jgi:hypothetical protein
MAKTKENKTAKKQDSTPQEPTLYFFYTQGCGWCKKVDPMPKTTPPSPPAPNADDKALDEWKVKYEEWAKENSHLPSLLESDTIVERFKQRRDGTAQAPPQAQIATNLNPDQEARLSRLEQKLDKLIKHLGVK